MTPSRKRPSVRRRSASTSRRPRKRLARRAYGWIPDLPDHRDYLYRALRPVPGILPPAVDLRTLCSSVEDQWRLGSCTANALVGALELLENKDKPPSFVDLSRLFVYYNERLLEHSVANDSGAMLRDGVKTLTKQGVCTESLWPYVVGKFAARPPASCYKDALNHRVTTYHRILTLDEMFACLAEGYPFVFGFTVYESFESAPVAKTGVVPMPSSGEQVLGGHAMTVVGYQESEKRFIVRNSWGSSWGMSGYCTMPYEYLADRGLSDDFWTLRQMMENSKQ